MVRATLEEQEIRAAIGAPGEGDRVVDGIGVVREVRDRYLYWAAHNLATEACEALARSSGCIVIVPPGFAHADRLGGCRLLEADDPRAAMGRVLEFVRASGRQPPWVGVHEVHPGARISPLAVVEGDVSIGDGVEIGPFCTVGPDVSIGRGSRLEAGVRVFPRTAIGECTTIGANTVIGAEGFGFVREASGTKRRIPQLGGVVIGSHVEISALVLVACGGIATTMLEDHVKVGDMTHIGHGVRVERGATVTGMVILGGSSIVGADAWVGINASVREGRRVGAGALVGMDVSLQDDLADDGVARATRPDVAPRASDDDRSAIGFAYRRKPPPT